MLINFKYKLKKINWIFVSFSIFFVNYNISAYALELSRHDIKMIQSVLKQRGYEPGKIDGKWGDKSKAALINFLNDNRITSNGEISEKALDLLGFQLQRNTEDKKKETKVDSLAPQQIDGKWFLAMQKNGKWISGESNYYFVINKNNTWSEFEKNKLTNTGIYHLNGKQLILYYTNGNNFTFQIDHNRLLLNDPTSGKQYSFYQVLPKSKQVTTREKDVSSYNGMRSKNQTQNHLLKGKFCSFKATNLAFSTYSSSRRIRFDGAGNFIYGGKSFGFNSTSGSSVDINRSAGNRGFYKVQGDIITILFEGETSNEKATIYRRSDDGRIIAITFRDTIYAKELCPN